MLCHIAERKFLLQLKQLMKVFMHKLSSELSWWVFVLTLHAGGACELQDVEKKAKSDSALNG